MKSINEWQWNEWTERWAANSNAAISEMKANSIKWRARQQSFDGFDEWSATAVIQFSSFKRKKVFFFIRELLSELKRYYNSMLKVISWYKLNHKWKTTWIWWKLAGMIGDEFMKWDDF